MDIRSIIPGLRPAETLSHGTVEESARSREGQAAETATPAKDAVELTSVGSTSRSGSINTDLLLAKAVLSRTETLDESRRAQILERIQSGFYRTPDVLSDIAGAMSDELKGNTGA